MAAELAVLGDRDGAAGQLAAGREVPKDGFAAAVVPGDRARAGHVPDDVLGEHRHDCLELPAGVHLTLAREELLDDCVGL